MYNLYSLRRCVCVCVCVCVCHKGAFLDLLNLEDEMIMLLRNVGKELPLYAE
jgi:hypothetical protein